MNKPHIPPLIRHASLRQLQVFEAIARHLSFTRAAEELHLAQPTVSAQIKNLTEAIGLPLFEQVGKKIYLTDGGKKLYRACREVFSALENFEMEAAEMKGLKQGRLRLAVVTTAKYFAPRLLSAFLERHPSIDVALKVTNRERLLERMADNVDDLYIMGHPPEDAQLAFQHFLQNPLVVIAPAGHPLADTAQVSLQALAAQPFIMREVGSGTRLAVEQQFQKLGIEPHVRMELGSNEAIKQVVAAGLGIAVVSRHALLPDAASEEIVVLDVEGFPIYWDWYIGHLAVKQLSVVARAFLAFVEESAPQMFSAEWTHRRHPLAPNVTPKLDT